VKENPIYKEHRIHANHLPASGQWISTIVKMGEALAITKDSLTDKVTRVPGEFSSEAEALQGAIRYIDGLEGGA
jgi:hypothetical protein